MVKSTHHTIVDDATEAARSLNESPYWESVGYVRLTDSQITNELKQLMSMSNGNGPLGKAIPFPAIPFRNLGNKAQRSTKQDPVRKIRANKPGKGDQRSVIM